MNVWIKKFYLFYALFFLSACGAGSISTDPDLGITNFEVTENGSNGNTAVITVSWIPPTAYTNSQPMFDFSHYKIYYGTSSERAELEFLTNVDSTLTSIVLENDSRLLTGNTYYFGMTAVSYNNQESPMSEIVTFE